MKVKGNPSKGRGGGHVIASGEDIKIAEQHPSGDVEKGAKKSRTAKAYTSCSHTLKRGCT